jgi:sugar phosphate isomerase/epimerase
MDFNDLFSLSTCWNIDRHHSARALVDELRETGFRRFELNYHVTREMAEDIVPMVKRGEIGISSVHNVFPEVYDETYGTDSLLLGYPDAEKRRRAIELTLGSVEYAARYGAAAVVIHPGEIPLPLPYEDIFERMYDEGKIHSEEYERVYAEFRRLRAEGSPRYCGLIRDSLETICEHMAKKGWDVKLGIETRSMCHQIPDFDEAHRMLDGLKGLPVYFWNDIGHGMGLEQLGMFDCHTESLGILGRTIGMHIHDVRGNSGHFCPYRVSDKVDKYLDIIRAVPIKVLEVGRECDAAIIRQSAETLANKLSAG